MPGCSQLARWRLVRFLDKAVEHDDSPTDERAIEDSCNALSAFEPKFKQAVAEGLGVGLAQIGPQSQHSAREKDIAGSKRIGQSEDFCLDSRTVVGDRIVHMATIT